MFNVEFCKTIWDGESPESSTKFAMLHRSETLPFAPTPGVEIMWGVVPEAIRTVRWQPARVCFVCNMKDEFPYEIGSYTYDFAWLLDHAISTGWTVVSPATTLK